MTAATLVLEAAMLHPRWPDLVKELRGCAPPHVLDQADAATAHTDGVLRSLADVLGVDPVETGNVLDIPAWQRLGALSAFTSWVSGEATTCVHSPDPGRPQPVLAAAWKPGLITCGACVQQFATRRGSDFDRTCDSCGRVCAGPEDDDGIYPGAVQVACLIWQYGACSDCHTPPAITPQPRARPRGSRGRARGRGRR
jgi:hypothetical protein